MFIGYLDPEGPGLRKRVSKGLDTGLNGLFFSDLGPKP